MLVGFLSVWFCSILFCVGVVLSAPTMCTMYMPGAYGSQKGTGPLKSELQMVVSHHVGAGN